MFNRVRAFLLSLTIIAVLVFSAVGTTVAYADRGITPDAPPPRQAARNALTTVRLLIGGCGRARYRSAETGKPGPDTVDGETTNLLRSFLQVPVEEAATTIPTKKWRLLLKEKYHGPKQKVAPSLRMPGSRDTHS
jgi:hypothetical protein